MKKKKITYGVSGMMEYQAIIKIGRSVMKILFTDGSMNAMGANPATYTTDSLMVQHAIENSDQFKRGRIYVVRAVSLDEDVHIDRNRNSEESAAPQPGTPETKGGAEEKHDAVENELTEMEFDNNDDARDFLESQFGYVRSKLRNRADIVAAGEAHGISICFA